MMNYREPALSMADAVSNVVDSHVQNCDLTQQ